MRTESPVASPSLKKPHLVALDGLRGVAALGVVLLHWFSGNGEALFHYSLMAVDFFFMLSGFVIAYSYEDRLRDGLPLRTFMVARLIRLYPMILLGIGLGLLREIVKRLTEGHFHHMDDLVEMTVLNLFMVPTLGHNWTMVVKDMFPLNIVLWSLLFEFIAYFLYASLFARRGKWILALTIVAAVPGVIYWIYNSFDDLHSLYAFPFFNSLLTQSVSRLLFAYFLGVWLFRNQDRLRFIPGLTFSALAALTALLFALPTHALPPEINVLIMIGLLPAIVVSASRATLGSGEKAIGIFIGNLSYPLYVVHTPLMWTLGAVFKTFMPGGFSLTWALIIVPAILVFSYLCLRFYDEPVRACLTRIWARHREMETQFNRNQPHVGQ